MLQNEPLDVQKLDDTAENGPSQSSKSCPIWVHVDIYGVGPAGAHLEEFKIGSACVDSTHEISKRTFWEFLILWPRGT